MGEVGTKPWFGFDLKTQSIVNVKEKGIIDPTKVTRNALENASSVACIILLTEAVVADIKEDKENDGFNPMMGMM
jgi:chaperonin GroEL